MLFLTELEERCRVARALPADLREAVFGTPDSFVSDQLRAFLPRMPLNFIKLLSKKCIYSGDKMLHAA